MKQLFGIVVLTAICSALLLGCVESRGEATEVAVSVDEWSVKPAVVDIPAGRVTFVVTNDGGTEHELVVAPADDPGDPIDEVENIQPDQTKRVTVNFEEGKEYELGCHIVEGSTDHYNLGMHTVVRAVKR